MRTIMAHSNRGAVKEYIRRFKPKRGDQLSVKQRGHGDWVHYNVT